MWYRNNCSSTRTGQRSVFSASLYEAHKAGQASLPKYVPRAAPPPSAGELTAAPPPSGSAPSSSAKRRRKSSFGPDANQAKWVLDIFLYFDRFDLFRWRCFSSGASLMCADEDVWAARAGGGPLRSGCLGAPPAEASSLMCKIAKKTRRAVVISAVVPSAPTGGRPPRRLPLVMFHLGRPARRRTKARTALLDMVKNSVFSLGQTKKLQWAKLKS